MSEDYQNMIGKICIVTGATSGIGKATAKALAEKGATVILVGRNKNKCEAVLNLIVKKTSNKNVSYFVCDLTSQKDIQNLSTEIHKKFKRIDVLINNAGARFMREQKSVDGIEMTLALNHLAYFLLSNLLLDLLKKSGSSRIINVSSSAHSKKINFEDIQFTKKYDGKKTYRQSKLANILFTFELAKKLSGTNVTVNALNPGGVATNFSRNNGIYFWAKHLLSLFLHRSFLTAEKGALTSIYLASSTEVEGITGEYFFESKKVTSKKNLYNEEESQKLWKISEELTKI